jgi:coproporphyrinogen III oxidase
MSQMKARATEWFQQLQDDICTALEQADGLGCFEEDRWERPGGGGGRSRAISGGRVIEKGGVNFSAVHGDMPEKISQALGLPPSDFYATGVSIVLHPKSPMVPIIHMNTRYFEMGNGACWFGGGIDLTPHYVDEADARHFHQALKAVCDRHHEGYYPRFKQWADDYFYLKHRGETRGVGGIFYDRLGASDGISLEERFDFTQDVGRAFAPLYTHFMRRNADLPYGQQESDWQLLRRSRYVEFNLVWDKGTKFGLDTEGRTESILMSMPPMAAWRYNHAPEPGTREEATLALLRKGIDWAGGTA